MITKKDAILIAQTFAKATKFDIENHCKNDAEKARVARGVLFRCLDDMYYDVLSLKVRDQLREDNLTGSGGREGFLSFASAVLEGK